MRASYRCDSALGSSIERLMGEAPLRPDVERLVSWACSLPASDKSRLPIEGVCRGTVQVEPLQGGWLESRDLDVLAADLRHLVSSSISRAVEGCRRVAISLGGLDSSGLLALLRESHPSLDVVALTYDMQDEHPDRPFAEHLCRFLSVPLHLVSTVEPLIGEAMVLDRRPFPMVGAALELRLMRQARGLGAEVVLDGFPGDDVLGGHLELLGAARLFRSPIRSLRCAFGVELPGSPTRRDRLRSLLLSPLLQRMAPRSLRLHRMRRHVRTSFPWLTPLGAEIAERSVAPLVDDVHRSLVTPNDVQRFRLEGSETLDVLDARCQLEVGGGIRRAQPLLDPAVVRYAARIPPETLSADGVFRGLFRRALRGTMPEAVRLRRTKSDGSLERARLAKAADPWTQCYARLPRLERLGLVDGSLFASQLAESSSTELRFWPFIAAEAFLERECS